MQLHEEEVLHPGLLSFTIKSVMLAVLAALYVIMDLFCFDMWACGRSEPAGSSKTHSQKQFICLLIRITQEEQIQSNRNRKHSRLQIQPLRDRGERLW